MNANIGQYRDPSPLYKCGECHPNTGWGTHRALAEHVIAAHGGPMSELTPSVDDVLAARELLNRHPTLPLPGDPDQKVFGMSYEEWAKYGAN